MTEPTPMAEIKTFQPWLCDQVRFNLFTFFQFKNNLVEKHNFVRAPVASKRKVPYALALNRPYRHKPDKHIFKMHNVARISSYFSPHKNKLCTIKR
jgi:hypothetical protein